MPTKSYFRKYGICPLILEMEKLKINGTGLTCPDAHARVKVLGKREANGKIFQKYQHAVTYSQKVLNLTFTDLVAVGEPYWSHFLYGLSIWRKDWACIYDGHHVYDEIGKFLKVTDILSPLSL